MIKQVIFICCSLWFIGKESNAQPASFSTKSTVDSVNIRSEIITFFDQYGEDLRKHRRQQIANRYDATGYMRVGNGLKRYYTFDELSTRYLTSWMPPLGFVFKDLSIEIVSPDAVVVTGLFDFRDTTGTRVYSYSSLLVKRKEGWRIRLEDESASPLGYTTQSISGSPTQGLFKYSLRALPASSIAAHRHDKDMRIKVISGSKFILMGNLDTARVQRFGTGASFVIPANTWHLEWWEVETIEEIEIMAPWKTERATPLTPR